MENQDTQEQVRIKELEAQVFMLEDEKHQLQLINNKLGYSTKIMSEFHLTPSDKQNIANSIDLATSVSEVKTIYDEYYRLLYNKALTGELEEFQMSPDFKDNIINYLVVAIGYDPLDKISSDVVILKEYFDFENKIRSTPDTNQRLAMTDKLLEKRTGTTEALNRIIDVINEFNKSVEQEI